MVLGLVRVKILGDRRTWILFFFYGIECTLKVIEPSEKYILPSLHFCTYREFFQSGVYLMIYHDIYYYYYKAIYIDIISIYQPIIFMPIYTIFHISSVLNRIPYKCETKLHQHCFQDPFCN